LSTSRIREREEKPKQGYSNEPQTKKVREVGSAKKQLSSILSPTKKQKVGGPLYYRGWGLKEYRSYRKELIFP